MPSKRNQPLTTGPQAKRCRTCGDLYPVGALTFRQCPDCAGLVALPLRGAGGRFISFATTQVGSER
jgi:hypothetical protein